MFPTIIWLYCALEVRLGSIGEEMLAVDLLYVIFSVLFSIRSTFKRCIIE